MEPHKIVFLFITSMIFQYVGILQQFMWGPLFVGAPVRPNMLNMPKSTSDHRQTEQKHTSAITKLLDLQMTVSDTISYRC